MWTTGNRCRYDRSHLRYESDLTDEERAEIEPQIPPAKRGGNRRTVNIREVVNGLMCAATAKMAGYRHEQMAGRIGPKGGWNPTVAPV